MTLKLGWKAGTEQYPPQELLDYAVTAEEIGFDSVDVSDHFHPWSERGQACFAWTWLGAAAVKTNRIMLGTGVTCPILRYHPAVIAQAAATLACLVPGRTFLGVGTGEALNEYAATGLWPSYKTRQAQVIEAIGLIRELWSGEKVNYRGSYYQTHSAKLYTLCDQKIPLFVSTMTPASAWFAGRYGDGLITIGGKDAKTYQEILKNFAAGAKEAGKDAESLPRIIELGVDFTSDIDKAIEMRKAYWAGVFVPALFTERIYTPKMSEQNGAAVGADTIRQSVCISADPEAHVSNARRYIDLGFNHLVFHSAGPDQCSFLRNYGRFVLPQLRGTQSA
jgi:coenzyme F420-dependent glucose-6-phosphate dehydrogenase